MSKRDEQGPELATLGKAVSSWFTIWKSGWDQFWFEPSLPHTLAVIRICCGAMLAYVHIVWACLIVDFMGAKAWINSSAIKRLHANDWGWSWLFYVENPALIWVHQIVAVVLSLMMMLGLFTRVVIPMVLWMTLMVCHRMTGALFGLDQVVVMLATYLMFARSGSVWSLDARFRTGANETWMRPSAQAAVGNTISVRLIQLHLCVIYLFGGLSKMRGEMWFEGSALWYTAVNYEYQSLDITWLGHFPMMIALLTASTIFWETFYCALVWPKITRPIALGMAVVVHGGIAVALGMVTFGTIMIVVNFAFIHPDTTRGLVSRLFRRSSR